jgi:hypothetical protein
VVGVEIVCICELSVGRESLSLKTYQQRLLLSFFVFLFHHIILYSSQPLMDKSNISEISPGTDSNNGPRALPVAPAEDASTANAVNLPDPIASPEEFTSYLLRIANPDLNGTWKLLQQRPLPTPGTNRLVEDVVNEWSDKMDAMVVSAFYLLFRN